MLLPCDAGRQLQLGAELTQGRSVVRHFIIALALSAGVAAAEAAESLRGYSLLAPAFQQKVPSVISELRFGATAQDPTGPESGSANLTAEILSTRVFSVADPILNNFIPRFHLGGSANINGDTSFAYAGLTWTYGITPLIFIEGSFGGAVHNGETDPVDSQHNALGCTALFRESASLGIKVTEDWNLMTTVEHLSNAGLCSNNRGLTNWGLRVAYTF
jgi:hypothetical protein